MPDKTTLQINGASTADQSFLQLQAVSKRLHNLHTKLYDLTTGTANWLMQYRNLQVLNAYALNNVNQKLDQNLLAAVHTSAIVEPASRAAVIEISSAAWHNDRVTNLTRSTRDLGVGVNLQFVGKPDIVSNPANSIVDTLLQRVVDEGDSALQEPAGKVLQAQQAAHLAGHIITVLHDGHAPETRYFRSTLNQRIGQCLAEPKIVKQVITVYRTARVGVVNGEDGGFVRAGLQNQLDSLLAD